MACRREGGERIAVYVLRLTVRGSPQAVVIERECVVGVVSCRSSQRAGRRDSGDCHDVVILAVSGVEVCRSVEAGLVHENTDHYWVAGIHVGFDPGEKRCRIRVFGCVECRCVEVHRFGCGDVIDSDQELGTFHTLPSILAGDGSGVVLRDVLAVVETGADERDLATIAKVGVPLDSRRECGSRGVGRIRGLR